MALIDSEASLKQRCLPVEGDDSLFESLKANGVKTLRQLAFALGSPQTPPSDDSLKDLAAKVYKCAEGTQPTIGQIANVRMLIFEASTLVVAQLRAQATADDSDLAGRKLPHVEKQARLTSQKARLPGLLIEGELQPSYALVDACALMSESNSITWISPSRCTKRDAEVQQLGKEKTSLVQIEAGTLKVSSSSKLPDADTTTALQLLYCFQRRGLALDQCSLIGWSDHEWYVQSLMSYLHGEPVSGARPAIAQVIRADREAWTLMSREIEGPIGVKDAAGELVMAAALKRLAKDPRVVVHLVTAPQPQKVAPPPSIPTDSAAAAALAEKDTKKKKRKRLTGLVPESLKGCVTKIKVEETPAASSEASRASSDVESLAASILQTPAPFDKSSLSQLIELLPMQSPPRGSVGRSFAAGAYAKGGLYGLHSNTNLFPNVCAVFAAQIRSLAPGECFTSFIILDDCSAEVHRDSNNDDSHCNILLKLSEFQGGAVWVEGDGDIEVTDPKGRVLKGHELSWENNKITLDARNLYHATLPWTGRRLVLVGYHVRDFQRLPCDDRQRLIDIGFQCPSKHANVGHVGDYLFLEVNGRTADLHRAARAAGLCLPLDLGNDLESFQKLVEAEKKRLALVWCELPSQPCSSWAANLCALGELAASLEIPFVIAGSPKSQFWDDPFVLQLIQSFPLQLHRCDLCCHGDGRPRPYQMATAQGDWSALALKCSGLHSHAPWVPRKTGDPPPGLPSLFCQRVIAKAKAALLQSGVCEFGTVSQTRESDSTFDGRLALNALPRGRRNPALVQEFVSFKFVAVPADPPSADESLLAGLPKGARVLSRLTFDGGYEEACKTLSISSGEVSIADGKSELLEGELIRIGLPSEPKAFVQRAVQAGHPRDGSAHVSKLVVNAIKANFSDPPAQTVTSRAAALKHWTARAKQLEQKEEELHRSLPEHLRCLLEGKRLLLWQEMHEAAGSPDDQLITHMCDGFKLSGWLSQGGLFPPKVRPPSFSVSTLSCLAKGLNQSTIAKMRVRQDEDLEKATWQETEKELQKGWIFADTKSCIELCALARRFGIRQLDKVRVIDDASICGINATVGLKYGFQMHSIDRYAAWISKALRINEGRLPACKGRVYDLKSAYKQFGIHPTDRELFRFAVNKPGEAEPMIMGANSLPFGAVGSVAAFLRISLSIWLIGVRLFSIFWTAFFDDYGVTTRDELVANTDSCICAIFDLLGVEFAREGKKAPPFSRDFKLLGVRVDLNDAPRGIVRIGNTAERREELNVFIEDILQANCLDLKTAERLRGRLVFFEGFVFGRMSNSAIRTVDRAARAGLTSKRLPEDVRKSLVVIRERLRVAEPVTIATKNHHSWLIFTDGACEGEKKLGSIGGVIVGLSGHPISFFSEQVPQDIMKILLSNSQNPIFELELLPVLVAYRLWGQWCRFSQAVFYLDNEGARHSIIAAGGGADLARVIIDGILSKETSLQIHAWYARVPTHSNIADSPSRGEYEGLLNIGCSRLRVDWDAVARQCFPLG
ncbi:dnajb6-b [Symbiodinium sp. CCMP2592]|nr:dnajb6-b [Symbiodinium sp. CCMP2592]